MNFRFDKIVFPYGKRKALTLSYDDGVTQDKKLINLLNKYNLKATFNLNSGKFGEINELTYFPNKTSHNVILASEVKKLYTNHEVAIHGLNHMDLSSIPSNTISYEIIQDRHNLEKIVEYPVRGMVYPFGLYNANVFKVLKMCEIEYSRTTKSTYDFNLPQNFLEWCPTCSHKDSELLQLANKFLKENIFSDRLTPKIFYLWGHSYELDGLNLWNTLEEFFSILSFNSDIWYATNIEIVDYINSIEKLKYSVDGNTIFNPTNIDVWLNINDILYQIPSGNTIHIV